MIEEPTVTQTYQLNRPSLFDHSPLEGPVLQSSVIFLAVSPVWWKSFAPLLIELRYNHQIKTPPFLHPTKSEKVCFASSRRHAVTRFLGSWFYLVVCSAKILLVLIFERDIEGKRLRPPKAFVAQRTSVKQYGFDEV